MSADMPAVQYALIRQPDDLVLLYLTVEEAETIRDIVARVAGRGGRALIARQVFEVLESELGYDCLEDDGLDGEIEAAEE